MTRRAEPVEFAGDRPIARLDGEDGYRFLLDDLETPGVRRSQRLEGRSDSDPCGRREPDAGVGPALEGPTDEAAGAIRVRRHFIDEDAEIAPAEHPGRSA